MDTLHTSSASPLYQQLVSLLHQDLLSGKYPPGSRFPSEQELCATYKVSRVTVRKALDLLTKDGLLDRTRGKGSYVRMPKMQRSLTDVSSFSGACAAAGMTVETHLVSAMMLRGSETLLTELGLPEGSMVVEINRLRLADHIPVVLEQNCFSDKYRWLLSEPLEGSLYALLQSRHIKPSHATHEISMVYADASEAKLLGVSSGTALMCLKETIFDQDGHPLHTSLQKIRGDCFTFRI